MRNQVSVAAEARYLGDQQIREQSSGDKMKFGTEIL